VRLTGPLQPDCNLGAGGLQPSVSILPEVGGNHPPQPEEQTMTLQTHLRPDTQRTRPRRRAGRSRRIWWALAFLVAIVAATLGGLAIAAQLTNPPSSPRIVYQEPNANTREGRVPAYQEPNANTREGRVPAYQEPNANTREGRVPANG
jgi:hypothetical protein